jgi:hypothetical protein
VKGLPRSSARGPAARNAIIKQDIPVRARAMNVADGAPGFGTVVIGDLPEGNILFLGAVAYMRFTSASGTITATFDGDYSIGTAPTADNALAGAEVDLIPSTPLGAAVGKVSPVVRGASTDALGGGIFDNTDGSLELNLNLLIDDVAISGAAAFTVDGALSIAYIVLGDD